MKKPWPAALVAAALLLSACGAGTDPAEPEETKAPAQAATSPAEAVTDEPTGDAEVAEWDNWGDGVWPEGYSFELPDGVMLGSIDHDPEEPGYGLVGPPYRRIGLAQNSPLVSPPQPLDEGWLNEWEVSLGLAIGAEFFLEHFLDSDVLFRTYNRESEQEWFAGFAHRMTPELREHTAGLADEPMGRHTVPVSLGSPALGTNESDGDESDGEASEGFGNSQRALYEASGPRFANLEVALTSAELNGDYLELEYDSSQAFLLPVTLIGSGAEEVYSLTFDGKLELALVFTDREWKISYIYSAHSWTWDNDIV